MNTATQTFKNATLYRTSEFLGSVQRVDCGSITVETGIKWAQYDNATRVTYLPKGKRKDRQFVMGYNPFLVILPTASAIHPEDAMVPIESGTEGVTMSQSRYTSFDDRYRSDFLQRLQQANVTPLVMITAA